MQAKMPTEKTKLKLIFFTGVKNFPPLTQPPPKKK